MNFIYLFLFACLFNPALDIVEGGKDVKSH